MALVEDMADFFDLEGFAVSASYTTAGPDRTVGWVRVILNHNVSRFGGDASLSMYHTEILLLKEQVDVPKRGDVIDTGRAQYRVRGLVSDDGQIVTVAVD